MEKTEAIKLLAIDDKPDNLTVLSAVVCDAMPQTIVLTAKSGPAGIDVAAAEDPDVILLDIVMPGMDGFEVCRKLKADHRLKDIPVVFLTALKTDTASRVKALEVGADGFLAKPLEAAELTTQIRAMAKVKRANRLQQMEKERLEALVAERTRELRESEERYRGIIESQRDAVCRWRPDTTLTFANANYRALFGLSASDPLGMKWLEFIPETDRPHVGAFYRELVEHPRQVGYEHQIVLSDGSIRWYDWIDSPLLGGDGALLEFQSVGRDITDRKRGEAEREKLQAQLIQAQKMESVGRLAGGIAHDFNNKLTVMLGYAQMVMEDLETTDTRYGNLQEVVKAGKQSVDIVRQLLAFARKQIISPVVLDLNETLEGMLKMLRRLIGENIDLVWCPSTDLWPVRMDPSQIDQILANLCVNARDAIDGVGKIDIETENVFLDRSYCAEHTGALPGEYVMLAVTDDGCGMDGETQKNIFEPFFTTKEIGKGTGLGLSTVYGIVKQNQGLLNVHSEPGKGSTFKIYLPRHSGEAEATEEPGEADMPRGHGETILIVEDDAPVLGFARKIIEKLGYAVLASESPEEAVALAREHGGAIHLLITDVVLPGMSGRELAEAISHIRPNIGTLFMSGYTADIIAQQGVLEKGVHFIGKPFTFDRLARKVGEGGDGK